MRLTKFHHPDLVAAEQAVSTAGASLASAAEAIRKSCPHTFIGTADYDGDMRLCLQCGKEEHAPYYHTFLFSLKETPDRVFIPMQLSDFWASRIGGARPIQL